MTWHHAAAIGLGAYVGGWLGGLAIATLVFVWRIIPRIEGPPVLSLALTMQWLEVSIGVFYVGATGRLMSAALTPAYTKTILIGLTTVAILAVGIRIGADFAAARVSYQPICPTNMASLPTLIGGYAAGVVVTTFLQSIAFQYPIFTQAILALSLIRLVLIYLLLRRLVHPVLRWELIGALLLFEVVLGFTGFFSTFKEPLLLAGLVMVEHFDRQKASHWVTSLLLAVTLGGLSYVWMGVRAEYRQDAVDQAFDNSRAERLVRMEELVKQWARYSNETAEEDMDAFVDRIWNVYYPALAIGRIPDAAPHTDGELMSRVITHLVTPRILFPDKPNLPSDSDFVRQYAGVFVAGAEQGTSIGFGYMAESYVDFGVPLMFVPILLFGILAGGLHGWLLRTIGHRDLAIAVTTAVFWMNLYGFGTAWAKLIGLLITTIVYIGLVAWLLDRWLLLRVQERQQIDDQVYGVEP